MGNHGVANMEMEISYFNEFLYLCHKVFDVSDIQATHNESEDIIAQLFIFPQKIYVLVYFYFRTFNITRKHYADYIQQLCYIKRYQKI